MTDGMSRYEVGKWFLLKQSDWHTHTGMVILEKSPSLVDLVTGGQFTGKVNVSRQTVFWRDSGR